MADQPKISEPTNDGEWHPLTYSLDSSGRCQIWVDGKLVYDDESGPPSDLASVLLPADPSSNA